MSSPTPFTFGEARDAPLTPRLIQEESGLSFGGENHLVSIEGFNSPAPITGHRRNRCFYTAYTLRNKRFEDLYQCSLHMAFSLRLLPQIILSTMAHKPGSLLAKLMMPSFPLRLANESKTPFSFSVLRHVVKLLGSNPSILVMPFAR